MTKPDDILGKWNYGAAPQFAYGDETSYRKAMEFLDGPYIIEDWGCGTAWARKFVQRGRYMGIDGSWSMHCDLLADLRTYRSSADAILIRHILEHNWEWKKILENALASFQKKLCIVLFTPFGPETRPIGATGETIPDLSFRKEDLLNFLKPFSFTEETIQSATQYGVEHFFYITRTPAEPRQAKPSVSIIIPTFQHLEDLLKPNLKSLTEFTKLDGVEVIVVANGCTDGTEEYVRSLGHPFRILSFPQALGYTKAMNEGLKASTGDYIVFLNNDVVFLAQPRNQWIDQLLAPFKDNLRMGITGPLQLHDHYAEADVIIGFCLCISRPALQAAGGQLDDVYNPGGGEDIDLCCKVRNAGYVVRQVPQEGKPNSQWQNIDGNFMVWHKNNQTFKDVPDYWDKIVRRNGLVNVKRHNKNIKLNLFGEHRFGYVSLDDPSDLLAYIVMDPTNLTFEDGSVSEILAIHPFEWLRAHGIDLRATDLFRRWYRVLRPGGKLVVKLGDVVPTETVVRVALSIAGFTGINVGPEQQIEAMV